MDSIRVIDSHTGGEPTRLIIEGLPDIGGSVQDRLEILREKHDSIRKMLCLEPRGNPIAIGAAIFPASDLGSHFDVVFFNNEGYLGMCGHGTIGVFATMAWLGKLNPGAYKINTVAGNVEVWLHNSHEVSFENVPSYRHLSNVEVNLPGWGRVVGDVAYGGNWFFLVKSGGPEVSPSNLPALSAFTTSLMAFLQVCSITGANGEIIDHIEVFGSSTMGDSRNFVLCPGGQYDRSPCGTGTSAKIACLASDNLLKPGELWIQESIIGSFFEASFRRHQDLIIPKIKGSAFVTADLRIVAENVDPFLDGF